MPINVFNVFFQVSNFVVCKVRFGENTDSDDEEEERPTRANKEDKEVKNGESMIQARKNK